MRQRLSWDKEKAAEIEKKADPYTMNQDHRNPPVSKYQTGDPSAWAEDPHMATPWKNEGRTETGHPAPAREAVVTARKLEDKAIKCITIAQRMLPGASDEDIENQATDLMFMPENSILATLQRQASVAEAIAKAAQDEEEEEGEKKEEEEEKEAGKKEEMKEEEKEAGKKEEDTAELGKKENVEAGKKKEDTAELGKKENVEAGKKEDMEEEKKEKEAGKKEEMKEEEKEAGKKEEEMKEEEKEAGKKEEMKEEEKEAGDLLDQIFATELSETNKTGAKKLSGIVKQASSGSGLDNIWESAPNVSHIFGK